MKVILSLRELEKEKYPRKQDLEMCIGKRGRLGHCRGRGVAGAEVGVPGCRKGGLVGAGELGMGSQCLVLERGAGVCECGAAGVKIS